MFARMLNIQLNPPPSLRTPATGECSERSGYSRGGDNDKPGSYFTRTEEANKKSLKDEVQLFPGVSLSSGHQAGEWRKKNLMVSKSRCYHRSFVARCLSLKYDDWLLKHRFVLVWSGLVRSSVGSGRVDGWKMINRWVLNLITNKTEWIYNLTKGRQCNVPPEMGS